MSERDPATPFACTVALPLGTVEVRIDRRGLGLGDRGGFDARWPDPAADAGAPVTVPVELDTPAGAVSLFTVMAHVGAPADVTVEELAVELFYPSDPASADRLAVLVGG